MIEWIKNFQLNSELGILLYWLPVLFCTYGYIARTARNYVKDKRKREDANLYYQPSDTLGTLLGRGLITIIPVANILAALFDLSPEVFCRIFSVLEKIFDAPLVPDSPFYQEKREKLRNEITR